MWIVKVLIILQLMIFLSGCSAKPQQVAGTRKASEDGHYQIYYLTENLALYKKMHEEGLLSLPQLVAAKPHKKTFFEEEYSTGDRVERELVNFVWKINVSGTNCVFGIGLRNAQIGYMKIYFAIKENEPIIFTSESEWTNWLGSKSVSPITLRFTSEIVEYGNEKSSSRLPAWKEPQLEVK